MAVSGELTFLKKKKKKKVPFEAVHPVVGWKLEG